MVTIEGLRDDQNVTLRIGYWSANGANGNLKIPMVARVRALRLKNGCYVVKAPPDREVCEVLREHWETVKHEVSERGLDAKEVLFGEE